MTLEARPTETEETAGLLELFPLTAFYARANRPLPAVRRVSADELPAPCHSLLNHERDMTSTLERHFHDRCRVNSVTSDTKGEFHYREVTLILDKTERAVEYGAIRINLGALPPTARRLVLEEQLPSGRILTSHNIRFESKPKAFFKVLADDWIGSQLTASPGAPLYGRHNTLRQPQGPPLAEIVEILPPLNDEPSEGRNSPESQE